MTTTPSCNEHGDQAARTAELEPGSASPEPGTVPLTEEASTGTRSMVAADYLAWGWSVILRRDQIWLRLQHDLIAIMIPALLAAQVTKVLTARRRSSAVLAHPYAPSHRVLLAGEPYGVALSWPRGVQRITGTVLLPPSVTPRGPVTWVQRPEPDTLRPCREIELFFALRTALSDQLPPTGQVTQANGVGW